MGHAIRLSDLQAMTDAERSTALARLSADARGPLNGNASVIETRIRGYESRYEMSTAQLVERLKRGEQRETAEIIDWLFWVNIRSRVDG